MKLLVILCFAVGLIALSEAKVRYDHYHVYRVHFTTDDQFKYLYQMDLESTDIMFWQISHSQHYADIMVAPEKSQAFLNTLRMHGLTFELTIEDVQKIIDAERM